MSRLLHDRFVLSRRLPKITDETTSGNQSRTGQETPVIDSQPSQAVDNIRQTRIAGIRVDAISSTSAVSDRVSLALANHQPLLVTFANPATAVVGKRRRHFPSLLEQFDLVAPDGIAMVLVMRMLHGSCPITRVSFDDTSLAPSVFALAAVQGVPVVLVGGKPGVAERAKLNLQRIYPTIIISGTFDGYSCPHQTVARVLRLCPRIVVAGMGTLIQEEFLLSLASHGWKGVGFTCGGYLDQVALRGSTYYPRWVDRLNLRWAYRLMMEPRRLWRRYIVDYPEFGLQVLLELMTRKKKRRFGLEEEHLQVARDSPGDVST